MATGAISYCGVLASGGCMNSQVSLTHVRAKKARLASKIGKFGYRLLVTGLVLLALCSTVAFLAEPRLGWWLAALALLGFMVAAWYHYDLAVLPPSGDDPETLLAGDVLARLPQSQTPLSVWQALLPHWQVQFLLAHFMILPEYVEPHLSQQEGEMEAVWAEAWRLSQRAEQKGIETGFVALACMIKAEGLTPVLTSRKLSVLDLEMAAAWLGRVLAEMNHPKEYFGGIGRDWATGFTPILDKYGQNVSRQIQASGAHFGFLSGGDSVRQVVTNMEQGANGVAIIGQAGIGKTSHVYALAQRLLEGKSQSLAYQQVVSLNASLILSSAHQAGELERLMLTLFSEAAHAGNIVLFLDEAQLFFSQGTGSFDVSQILLPVLQSRQIRLILALTPNDFQRLKAEHPPLATLLTPVMLAEPNEEEVMRILEDTALGLEHKGKVLIAYEALREAYRLSGRYNQEQAYPGKAIQLLEQALAHASNGIISAKSVQAAIEQASGVKVGAAAPAEAQALLNLEDQIHQRMVNQSRAVSVVASALRRARAGVANPKRPIGSFLFLGPTGVGKTELAKAVAATYFGSEVSMVRLDMSEYQQESDVSRLLSDGTKESGSLIMSVRRQPFCVVLLDEIEKAHPNLLNLLLQMLDEGQLTDAGGRSASFKDCVIIATSNAGANEIRERVGRGEPLESFEQTFTDSLITSGQFKPELLNRFDEIVLFRPLNQAELAQVVRLMLGEVNKTLATQQVTVSLSDAAIAQLVASGYDPRLGARPMRRMIQKTVEDAVAVRILRGDVQPGSNVNLDVGDITA